MSLPTEQKENHDEQIWNESNLFIFIAAHILILEMNLVWCKKPKQTKTKGLCERWDCQQEATVEFNTGFSVECC